MLDLSENNPQDVSVPYEIQGGDPEVDGDPGQEPADQKHHVHRVRIQGRDVVEVQPGNEAVGEDQDDVDGERKDAPAERDDAVGVVLLVVLPQGEVDPGDQGEVEDGRQDDQVVHHALVPPAVLDPAPVGALAEAEVGRHARLEGDVLDHGGVDREDEVRREQEVGEEVVGQPGDRPSVAGVDVAEDDDGVGVEQAEDHHDRAVEGLQPEAHDYDPHDER